MRLLLIAILSVGTVLVLRAESQMERRLKDSIAIMAEHPQPGIVETPVMRGVHALLVDGPLESEEKAVVQTFEDLIAKFGRPVGSGEAGARLYGPQQRAEVGYFVITFAKGVAFLRLVSLRALDNKRLVTGILIQDRPEGIFPPGLLEPEPLTPRGR